MSKKPDYPPLSKEEIAKETEAMEKAKAKYSMEQTDVESALTEYLDVLDPIIWENPKTKETKAIAWVRRPSMKQLKDLIPPSMTKYINNPKSLPEEEAKEYEKFFYKKMAELIVVPKYTAEQWETKANPWFIRKFWDHIAEIAKFMQGQIEGF